MSTTPYLITDSSAESSSEDIQHSFQATNFDHTENYINLKGPINSSSKNSNKHDCHEHSAKIGRSKEKRLRIRRKLDLVCEYIDELSDELSDEAFKICKICKSKWAEGTSISTVKRHFQKKHPLIFKGLQKDS
ncbi:33537_t:CDS:1, partial [Racocetra persica]